MSLTLIRFTIAAGLVSSAFAADVTAPSEDLYRGWLNMYDLRFDEAHQVFKVWEQSHPADPLGPASDAAAYLFSELARLGTLESELFTDDTQFKNRTKLRQDPRMKTLFDGEIQRADQLAEVALQANAGDVNALFAKTLTFGLRADSSSLIEKRDLAALKYTKEGRVYGDKLMAIDPKAYDAYLGTGIENYLLSLKPGPLRILLRLTGSLVDREKGVAQLRLTAQHGHYLEPFAKLLLAVAALRDHNREGARELLSELHNRFPHNPLFARELDLLGSPPK
jgi:hypothetical protein